MNFDRTPAPVLLALAFVLLVPPPFAWAEEREPALIHGFGEVLAGIFWEPPKTVLDATLSGPPVVGTAVGVLGGLSKGIQRILRGLQEISAALSWKRMGRSR